MDHATILSPFILPQEEDFLELVQNAKDFALLNGVAMRSKKHFSVDSVEIAPFTLLPSPFPKKEFEKAIKIQLVINELIHNVAHDYDFLKNVLKNTVEVDDFIRRLFSIYETVYKEGFGQSYSLGLIRSDYMVDNKIESLSIKQVEMNTIASSLAGLSTQLSLLHRFVLDRLGLSEDARKKLPENNALSGLCEGLIQGWKTYNNQEAAILFVVEDVVYNICDQKFHEFEINKLYPSISVIRRTLTQLITCGQLNADRKLLVDGKEIAVVYFRSGYSPDQYPTEREWDVRLLLERSRALKCPSIHYHLAGTKKVQQELASETVLARFLKEPTKINQVSDIFTGLYSLDLDDKGDEAVKIALKNPHHYVLKPQREGGGNNVYSDEIPKVLSNIGKSKERTAYILMDRIQPPILRNYIVRPGNHGIVAENVVSELGIYGVIIGTKNQISINQQAGHMLRTKGYLANEGGVAAGIGALDSPLLF